MGLEINAIVLSLVFLAVLQLAIGASLVLKRSLGALRGLLAALFLLNGGISLAEAHRATDVGSLAPDWVAVVIDSPTGAILVGSVILLARAPPQWEAPLGQRQRFALVAAAGMGVVAVIGAVRADALNNSWINPVFAATPVFLAYAAIVWIATSRLLTTAPPNDARVHAWLLVGFGMRAAEFGISYGFRTLVGDATWPAWPVIPATLFVGGAVVLFVAVLASTGRLIVHALKPLGASRREAAAGALVLIAGHLLALPSVTVGIRSDPAWALIGLLSLSFVRPLGVGFALEPRRTRVIFANIALAFAGYCATKAFLGATLGVPFFRVGTVDFVALAASVAIVGAALAWISPPSPAIRSPRPGGVRAAERVIAELLRASEVAGEGWVGHRHLADVVGIRPSNLAAEIRRARRMLAYASAQLGQRGILERSEGVRRRKSYRLSPPAVQAAKRLVEGSLIVKTGEGLKAAEPSPGRRG